MSNDYYAEGKGLVGLTIKKKFNDGYGHHIWVKLERHAEDVRARVDIRVSFPTSTKNDNQYYTTVNKKTKESFIKIPCTKSGAHEVGFGIKVFGYTGDGKKIDYFRDVVNFLVSGVQNRGKKVVERRQPPPEEDQIKFRKDLWSGHVDDRFDPFS